MASSMRATCSARECKGRGALRSMSGTRPASSPIRARGTGQGRGLRCGPSGRGRSVHPSGSLPSRRYGQAGGRSGRISRRAGRHRRASARCRVAPRSCLMRCGQPVRLPSRAWPGERFGRWLRHLDDAAEQRTESGRTRGTVPVSRRGHRATGSLLPPSDRTRSAVYLTRAALERQRALRWKRRALIVPRSAYDSQPGTAIHNSG